MSTRRRFALPTVAVCVLLSAFVGFVSDRFLGDGWLFDVALWARAEIHATATKTRSDVIVIAIDDRSLRSEELKGVPRALFAPTWAKLLQGLGDAGADAVAFDLLLAFSGNNLKAGYDRDFLRALFRLRDKVVLARSETIVPVKPYLAALKFDLGALGLIEIEADGDEVYRRIRSSYQDADGGQLKSLVSATLARSGVSDLSDEIILAPEQHLEAMPAVALIDVLRCLAQAPESLEKVFGDRIVFIGSALAKEDRLLTSARFMAPPTPGKDSLSGGCDLPLLGASNPVSKTVPGVYLHAAAAEAVLRGSNISMAPTLSRLLVAAVAGGVGAAIGLVFAPWTAVVFALAAMALLWAGEMLLIETRLWLPTALAMFAIAVSTVLAYLVRYLVEERRRRSIQLAFGRYLAPSIVDNLMDNPDALQLGGTVRPVTVMFADLSGFTALSTTVGPEELVTLTNEYLALIADEVDRSGGYVDKYIGDAVMAIWGAPVPDSTHALEAVQAGLQISARIRDAARNAEARGGHAFGIKIGMHSGEAIVGNVGSKRRYNYTAVGETVNIAARMESLPGVYGCALMIGPTTAAIVGNDVLLREVDWVAVKGRDEPLAIHEAMATIDQATESQKTAARRYGEALGLYRGRQFREAAALWQAMQPDDGPARVMAERAREYARTPPPEDWDGVFVMSGK